MPAARPRALLALILGAALALPAAARPAHDKGRPAARTPAADASYRASAEARRFAEEAAARRGLPREWLASQLAQARRVPAVRKLIMPPPAGTAKNWAAYRERFIEPRRIDAGLAFWRDNAEALARAEQRWGVPAEIVVGIVGVETFYGRITGRFRIIDALATLAFDFPAGRRDRSAFFRTELEEFFVCARAKASTRRPSRAPTPARMGLPQFMPGSVNRWAVDYDGDGHIDLQASAADAVGSVAHYLAAHGWQRGTGHALRGGACRSRRPTARGCWRPDIVPSFSAAQFAERGAVLAEPARAHEGPLALVELQNGDLAPSFVAGTQNFYVLTRYNQSSYYAMAVIELGRAVAAARAAR